MNRLLKNCSMVLFSAIVCLCLGLSVSSVGAEEIKFADNLDDYLTVTSDSEIVSNQSSIVITSCELGKKYSSIDAIYAFNVEFKEEVTGILNASIKVESEDLRVIKIEDENIINMDAYIKDGVATFSFDDEGVYALVNKDINVKLSNSITGLHVTLIGVTLCEIALIIITIKEGKKNENK